MLQVRLTTKNLNTLKVMKTTISFYAHNKLIESYHKITAQGQIILRCILPSLLRGNSFSLINCKVIVEHLQTQKTNTISYRFLNKN